MKKLLLFLLAAAYTVSGQNTPGWQHSSTDDAAAWAEKTLKSLSLERKVAQLICTDISGAYISGQDPRLQKWIELARDYGIGGFVVYGGAPHDVAILTNKLQSVSAIPILMSADFEGGAGQQFKGASEFPANMAFAAAGDENLMYEAAKIMASEGRAMGVHLTYSPAVDISIDTKIPRGGVRSFGGNYDLIRRLLKAYVRGYTEENMITTAKHFPGQGDSKPFDDYPGFAYIDKSKQDYFDNDCKTFQYAVDAGVAFIMTEHIAAPAVTNGSPLPASVEPLLVKGVIRDRLGFKGIITSDDLWYPQVVNRFGVEEVAVKALEAGHDVILKPADPIATIKAISEAVRSGRIPEEQIDHSVRKLLIQKAALGLHKDKFVNIDSVSLKVGTPQNIEMVKRVADRSMTVLRNDGVLPVKIGAETKITHITIQKFDAQTPAVSELSRVFASSFNNVKTYNFKPFTSREYYDMAKSAATTSDIVVISFLVPFTRNVDATPIRDQDLETLNSILSTAKAKVIVMSYGNPYIIKKMESAPAFVTGFAEGDWAGNQIVYFDSFIRLLKGEYKPSGRLPIDLNEKYKIGFGLSYLKKTL